MHRDIVILLCGCRAVVNHESGERLIECPTHHVSYVVKAAIQRKIVYSVSLLPLQLFSETELAAAEKPIVTLSWLSRMMGMENGAPTPISPIPTDTDSAE